MSDSREFTPEADAIVTAFMRALEKGFRRSCGGKQKYMGRSFTQVTSQDAISHVRKYTDALRSLDLQVEEEGEW